MSNKQIIPADLVLPNRLHILPLSGRPFFPGILTPMMIVSRNEIEVVEQALNGDSFIGLLLLKDGENENPTSDNLWRVGTAAKIVKKINLPDGGENIFISTIKRFKVMKFINESPPY
jgi:ATP-dependent Lon protease